MRASGSLTSQRWMLALCFSLASVMWIGVSASPTETQKYTCKTFGSGVVQPFNGSAFYVPSNCPFTLTRFIHNRVESNIIIRRGDNGLVAQVEIIINKIRTVVQNGSIMVEMKSVSIPYDHTYQHIYQYGVYTRLRSLLLPLCVTWHNVPGGIDTLWVELEQELSVNMTGLCGKHIAAGDKQELIQGSALTDGTCQIRDPDTGTSTVCRSFFSLTVGCVVGSLAHYMQLCEENIARHQNIYVRCSFLKEVIMMCDKNSPAWIVWRTVLPCPKDSCPGDLLYVEQGAAFVPTCSNPNPRCCSQDVTSSCVCPEGMVLNDHTDGHHCVDVSDCTCIFNGRSYRAGERRSTNCQSCVCKRGKWHCSEKDCTDICRIEGQFVTTFDGKLYAVPGKCTYVVAKGLNWTIIVQFSEKVTCCELTKVVIEIGQENYVFTYNSVKVEDVDITEFHQSDNTWVFWQSSMYVNVHTSFGLKVQVQVFPEIQIYITLLRSYTGIVKGLCGNNNNDTTDDFTTSSGITESSSQAFALSWSVGTCAVNIPNTCSNTENEIFAEDKCSLLINPTGIFAACHRHIAVGPFHTACIQRTCSCCKSLQQCLCVALGNYAKACATEGVTVGDWRRATNCTVQCQKNQEFSYNMTASNTTCWSMSHPGPYCSPCPPVDGCGCPGGTHLNQEGRCTPKTDCPCYYGNTTIPPGNSKINGQQCTCKNGKLNCTHSRKVCRDRKVHVQCREFPRVNTAQKTCDSLNKPQGASTICVTGCYCPPGLYEDYNGSCVPQDNCSCVYNNKIFKAGHQVMTDCKTCVCHQGRWHCNDEPCTRTCRVYGTGHYQTFDSKWYSFDGHCQYTLVEDYCGNSDGSFSVRVENVPCCDEELTCSRSIVLDIQGILTLKLRDMRVIEPQQMGWTVNPQLYTIHTVGLYIVISLPSKGITLIWDKHTMILIKLGPQWKNRVCGLCGNFDNNEMNDLQISGSAAVSSALDFGNSWKVAIPPCSDVITERFPCERHSYCAFWAQKRCRIILDDLFNNCHIKVDPWPYYQACVQESCSCDFEGKFLGFCTAVAAYAEACSEVNVCVKWRTPDLCPVYCDYYNAQGQCTWHYEACGETLICGRGNITHKLEGCYPRCPGDAPYYDEMTGECTKLENCIEPSTKPTTVPTTTTAETSTMTSSITTPAITLPTLPTIPTTTHIYTTPITSTLPTTEKTELSTQPTTAPTMAETSTMSSSITTPATTLPTPPTIPTTTHLYTTPITSTLPTTEKTELSTQPTTAPTTAETSTMTSSITTSATTLPTPPTIPTTTHIYTTPITSTLPTTEITELSTKPTTAPTTAETSTMTSSITTPATTLPTPPTIPTTTHIYTTPITSTLPTTEKTELSTQPTTAPTTAETSTMTSSITTSATTLPTLPTIPTTTHIYTTPITSTLPTTEITELSTQPTTAPTMAETSTMTSSITTPATTLPTPPTIPTTTHIYTTPITSTLPTTEKTELSTQSTTAPTTAETSTMTSSITTSATTLPTLPTIPTTTHIYTTPITSTLPTTEITELSTQPTTAPTTAETSTMTSSITTPATTLPTPPTTPITTHTTPITSTTPVLLSTLPPHTPTTRKPCQCPDILTNNSSKIWHCNESRIEKCKIYTCMNGTITVTNRRCPLPTYPICPRNKTVETMDECGCKTWKCDCQCQVMGDPHYFSFDGVYFTFLENCTYILVEEQSPRFNLSVAVDTFFCIPGFAESCAKSVILMYQGNVATLSIVQNKNGESTVQATLNNMTIMPPHKEHGLRFETTDYVMSIYLPEIRSYVSLTSYFYLVVNLAMEHFSHNTQGQCGVCGGPSCIRRDGRIEDDSCCDKTAADWVYPNPMKPACSSVPKNLPCITLTTASPTHCPPNQLCELLKQFSHCSSNIEIIKKNCEFDSCRNTSVSCSSLEQAAQECKEKGVCIEWRNMTNGICGGNCTDGLVFKECSKKQDDFCYGGVQYEGAPPSKSNPGCFCPDGLIRAGNNSRVCVSVCTCCQGPNGEPKQPGDVWQNNCNTCTCNKDTRTVECFPRPTLPAPVCGPSAVLINTSCCGHQKCIEKTCSYKGNTYLVGDTWRDAARPCMSFSCSKDGIQTETKVCPREICPENERIWDDQGCCFTCNKTCAPWMQSFNATLGNCTTTVEMPVCKGQCASQHSLLPGLFLQVEQRITTCQMQNFEIREITLRCLDHTTRLYSYQHIISCQCRICVITHGP